jgi:hypothetical protein
MENGFSEDEQLRLKCTPYIFMSAAMASAYSGIL